MQLSTCQFAQHRVILAVHTLAAGKSDAAQAKLVWLDWLPEHGQRVDDPQTVATSETSEQPHWQSWQENEQLRTLCTHYGIEPATLSLLLPLQLDDSDPEQALLKNAITQLCEFASGERQLFELPLDISIGTPFQRQVWQALQQIGCGQTISYAQLAQQIGKPTAHRAVANANGRNPISILIPCHRVIASDGSIGGYTGGVDKKQLLLEIEAD